MLGTTCLMQKETMSNLSFDSSNGISYPHFHMLIVYQMSICIDFMYFFPTISISTYHDSLICDNFIIIIDNKMSSLK